jgi:F-type H+-transporting ATPase subunit b
MLKALKKLLPVMIVLSPMLAHAQESPEAERATAEVTDIDPTPSDPTEHFNWIGVKKPGSLFDYLGKDEYGGKFGDGVMNKGGDPDGPVITESKEEIDPASGKSHRVVEKAEEEPASPPFVFMLLNFGIFLLILGKTLWPAGQKMSRERHDQIKNALDDARQLREQAEKKLAEYEARIKGVDSEVKKIIDDIRAAAEEDKKRILESADRQAKQMKHDAEQRIAAEIETARHQLAKEVAAAAATATEKLLRDKTTPDDQRKLVGNFISGMGA